MKTIVGIVISLIAALCGYLFCTRTETGKKLVVDTKKNVQTAREVAVASAAYAMALRTDVDARVRAYDAATAANKAKAAVAAEAKEAKKAAKAAKK